MKRTIDIGLETNLDLTLLRGSELFSEAMDKTVLGVQKAGHPEAGNWRFGELEDFPARIAGLHRSILYLYTRKEHIDLYWAQQEDSIRKEFINAPEDKRASLIAERIQGALGYEISRRELRAIAYGIELLRIELAEVNQFCEVMKIRYLRQTQTRSKDNEDTQKIM
jgi:hypothetical protein